MYLLLIAAALGFLCWSLWRSRPHGRLVALTNDGALTAGEHVGSRRTGFMDSLYTLGSTNAWFNGNRFFLVKQGSDDQHYAPITSVLDQPIAVCTDDPASTTDPVNFQGLLGADKTQRMIAAGAIAAGKPVVTNGDGTIAQLGAAAGMYWCVGYALTTAVNAGDTVEVQSTLAPIGVAVLT